MQRRLFMTMMLTLMLALGGCGRDDPLAELEAAVQQLQDNLEAKNGGDVIAQLHPQFEAQEQYDSDWAKRTMTGLFLRHRNIGIAALTRHSRLDPHARDLAYTDATLILSGADNLIPDQAAQYQVHIEWRRDDGAWKLHRLQWK
jgi:predicted small lipoprotein YifL